MLIYNINNLRNIVNSVCYYIDNNIKPAYDAAIVGTTYNAPLLSGVKTEDVTQIAYMPFVEVELPLTARPADDCTGMGDRAVWQYLKVNMRVYPALDNDRPSLDSTVLLEELFHYYFGTSLLLPIYDFTQPTPYPQLDGFYMQNGMKGIVRGVKDGHLAIIKHRFDYSITLRYGALAASG